MDCVFSICNETNTLGVLLCRMIVGKVDLQDHDIFLLVELFNYSSSIYFLNNKHTISWITHFKIFNRAMPSAKFPSYQG
jgi:hypothetical protein